MPRTTEDIFDEWLVARYLAGGRNADDALRTLVSRWDRRLQLHARRLLQDGDAAAEVVQEGWIAIVRGLPRIEDPAAFRVWAYAIVSNKCRDWIRSRRRRRAALRIAVNTTTTEALAASPTPTDRSGDAVRRAIAGLGPLHRAVISLHYLDGLSIEEIAIAIGIPEGTVKSRLHAARAELRQTLDPTKGPHDE